MPDLELFADLPTPLVAIDYDRFEANVRAMAALAAHHDVALRPHIKTHKIPELAQVQLAAGAAGVTCATPREVEVMLAAGIRDATLAFPVVTAAGAEQLAGWQHEADVRVHLDSLEAARCVSDAAVRSGVTVQVRVDVDTGQGRLGVAADHAGVELCAQIAQLPGVLLTGVASHAGHSYRTATPDELNALARAEVDTLLSLQRQAAERGVSLPEVSVGATPTAAASMSLGITEARPGTYCLGDATQVRLGAATWDTVALGVVTTVVGRPSADRVVTDAGSKTLSSDWAHVPRWMAVPHHPQLAPAFLSEEHGVWHVEDGPGPAVGDRLWVVPAHACTVMNLADEVHLLSVGRSIGTLPVTARGHQRSSGSATAVLDLGGTRPFR